MKYLSLLIALMPFTTHAQVDVQMINERVRQADNTIGYTTVSNKFFLYHTGTAAQRIKVLPGDYDIYEIDYRGDTTVAILFFRRPGVKKINISAGGTVGEKLCTVREMPEPYPALNKERDSLFTREGLKASQALNVLYDDPEMEVYFKVISYVFETTVNGRRVKVKQQGPYFGKKINSIIPTLEPGTLVHFTDIIVNCPDCNYGLKKYDKIDGLTVRVK